MTLMFYLGALGLFVLGGFLLKRTSPYTRVGGAKFERRMLRRTVGIIVLIAATMVLVLAVLSEIVSDF